MLLECINLSYANVSYLFNTGNGPLGCEGNHVMSRHEKVDKGWKGHSARSSSSLPHDQMLKGAFTFHHSALYMKAMQNFQYGRYKCGSLRPGDQYF
jgi:hypothetical protein